MKYKTIPENKMSHGHKWKLNKWYKIDGELEMCRNGFHCSNNFIDAMGYVAPGYVVLVEVRGEFLEQEDKSVHKEMKIVKWKKWTKKDSIALAIFAAGLVLPNYEKQFPGDNRPREAIETAKKVLKYNNKKNKLAARLAVESAEWSAIWLARSAGEPAKSAVWSARSAGESAKSATRSAARSVMSAVWSVISAARSAKSVARSIRSAAESAKLVARSAAGYDKIIQQCHNFIMERKFK